MWRRKKCLKIDLDNWKEASWCTEFNAKDLCSLQSIFSFKNQEKSETVHRKKTVYFLYYIQCVEKLLLSYENQLLKEKNPIFHPKGALF